MRVGPPRNLDLFIPLCILLLYFAYHLMGASTTNTATASFINADSIVYVNMLLQAESPELFSKDPFYASGLISRVTQHYASLYLWGMARCLAVTNGNMQEALMLYAWVMRVIAGLGMFGLTYTYLRDGWVSILLVLVSLMPSNFAFTGTIWGMYPNNVTTILLHNGFSLCFLWAVYALWRSSPTVYGRQWRYLLWIGLASLYALLTVRTNVIVGVSLMQWLCLLGGLLVWQKRLGWLEWVLFSAAFGLTFGLFYFVGSPSKALTNDAFSWESAQAIIQQAQTKMVFPWRDTRRLEWLGISSTESHYLYLLALYLGASLGLGGVYWRWRMRWMLLLLVGLQCALAWLLMNAGALPLLIAGYAAWRIGQHTWDAEDTFLVVGCSLALMLGVIQQIILYYWWQTSATINLTTLVFEAGRFIHFAYIPFYLLLGRLAWQVSHSQHNAGFRILSLACMGVVVAVNLNDVPFPIQPHLWGGSAAILMGLGLGALRWLSQRWWRPSNHWLMPILLLGTLITLLGRQSPTAIGGTSLTSDYLAMTSWVRHNTTLDSLFFVSNFSPSFRYYGQRSMLAVAGDWPLGMYSDTEPLALRRIEERLETALADPQMTLTTLQDHQVDYWILAAQHQAPFDSESAIVFQNAAYTIYQVDRIPQPQSAVMAAPRLRQAFGLFTPPWPSQATIFNPAQGSVIARQDVIHRIVEAHQMAWTDDTLAILHVLHAMRFEIEMPYSLAQTQALANWRKTKSAHYLAEAAIDYLVYDSQWVGFVSEAEYQTLTDPAHYRLVGQWQAGERVYWLYHVLNQED